MIRTGIRLFHFFRIVLIGLMAVLGSQSAAATKKITAVAVLVGDLGNPFFAEIGRGVETAVRSVAGSDVKVTVSSSGYDVGRQISQINELVSAGYGMIILNAADTTKVAASVRAAIAKGVVVVAVDVNAEGAEATVTSDNVDAGRQACNYLAGQLAGKGSVVILNGPPVSAVIDRVAGCHEALVRWPEIKVLSDDQNAGASFAGGLASMSAVMAEQARIDAVFAINDPSAIGAEFAAKQAGRKDFFIVSVDASPEALKLLRSNDSQLIASVSQDPSAMATKAVDIGISIFNGAQPPAHPILIPVKIVTRGNVEQFPSWSR